MIHTIVHFCTPRRMFNIQRLCISVPVLYVIFLDSLLVAQLESRSVTGSIPNALTSASGSVPSSLTSSSNGLDSRASGLNSRYLNPLSSSVVTSGATSSSSNNNGIQQQQLSVANNLQAASNSNQQLQQQNNNNVESNLQRLSINATPMLSTTYSYNGNIGQYVPSDISASSVLFKPNNNNNLNLNMPYGQYNQLRPISTVASLVSTPNSNQFTYIGQNAGLNNQWPNSNNLFSGSSNHYNNLMRNNHRNNQNSNLFSRPNPYHHSMMNQLSHMNNLMRPPINSVNNHLITDTGTGVDDYYQQLDQSQYSISSNNQQQSSFNNLDGNYANNVAQIDPFIGSSASNLVPSIQMPSPGFSGYSDNYKGNDQCISADNRHGTCYPASECMKRGGTPMGKCGGLNDHTSSGSVCCSCK